MALPAVSEDQRATAGSTIVVEELDSVFPSGKLRKLTLSGSALPFMGQAKWSGVTKTVTTWFPGNGLEASQQVLGAQVMPSQWTGKWTRTRLGRTPLAYVDENGQSHNIVDPHVAWQVFEDIRIGGARLRVTWALRGVEIAAKFGRSQFASETDRTIDFSIIREGRLTQIDITPERWGDFPWTMQFDWVSSGGRQERVATVLSNTDTDSAAQGMNDAIDALATYTSTSALVSRNSQIRLSAGSLTLGKLEALAKAPQLLINNALHKLQFAENQVKRAGDLAAKIGATPDAIAASVVAWANDSKEICRQFASDFGHTPPETQSNKTRVADVLRSYKFFAKGADLIQKTQDAALDLQVRLRQAATAGGNAGADSPQNQSNRAADAITIHVCHDGDTPTSVSVKYFGNPDNVIAILKANKLPLHLAKFNIGQIIVIPSGGSNSTG